MFKGFIFVDMTFKSCSNALHTREQNIPKKIEATMRFAKKVKQEISDKISIASSELFPGKKISGTLYFPTAHHDIMIGYDKNENVTPDIWIDFIFTHDELKERSYGTFEKIKEVDSVPIYEIIITDYNDFERRDFFDTIYHEVRHAWQRYNGYVMSEHDAEGYAGIMAAQNI